MILHIYPCEEGNYEFVISDTTKNLVVKQVDFDFLDNLIDQLYDMLHERSRTEVKLFIRISE